MGNSNRVLCIDDAHQQPALLPWLLGIIGLTSLFLTPMAGAQEQELMQLESFLTPAPQPQPPPPTVQPARLVPPPASSPQPLPRSPQLPAPSAASSSVLALNSHRPGTLGRPNQLNEGYYLERYQFEGDVGTPVMLNAIGSNDALMQLDPVLTLIGPDGSILAEDDNSGVDSARGDARIVLVLPDTGTYTIVVTTAAPNDRGRYSIGLVEVEDTVNLQ